MQTKKEKTDVVVQEQPATAITTSSNDFLELAKSKELDIETLKALIEMKREEDEGIARRAFVASMTAFKANPPKLHKTGRVDYMKKDNTRTQYSHAELDVITEKIGAALAEHDLSHNFKLKQDTSEIEVTCVITHVLGHSESVSLKAGADGSGGKNSIQAVGSTVSYLERYTLLAATGLAAGRDDDGRGSEGEDEKISEDQLEKIKAVLNDNGVTERRLLNHLQLERVEDVLANNFDNVIAGIEKAGNQ